MQEIENRDKPTGKLEKDTDDVPRMILDISTYARLIRDDVDISSRISSLQKAAEEAEQSGKTDDAKSMRNNVNQLIRGMHLTELVNNPSESQRQQAKASDVFTG